MRLRVCLIVLGAPLAAVAFGRGIDIYPQRAAVTVGQGLQPALTGDPAGVSWSVSPDGGSIEPPVSHSGQAVILTAPRRYARKQHRGHVRLDRHLR